METPTSTPYATGCMPNTDFQYEELEGLLACYHMTYQEMALSSNIAEVTLFVRVSDILVRLAKRHNLQIPVDTIKNPRAKEDWGKPKKFSSYWSTKDSFNSYRTDFGICSNPDDYKDLKELHDLITGTTGEIFAQDKFFTS